MEKLKQGDQESYCMSNASVIQLAENQPFKLGAAGSTPAGGIPADCGCNMLMYMYWLQEENRRAYEAFRRSKHWLSVN